jgi:hypothetical protein
LFGPRGTRGERFPRPPAAPARDRAVPVNRSPIARIVGCDEDSGHDPDQVLVAGRRPSDARGLAQVAANGATSQLEWNPAISRTRGSRPKLIAHFASLPANPYGNNRTRTYASVYCLGMVVTDHRRFLDPRSARAAWGLRRLNG